MCGVWCVLCAVCCGLLYTSDAAYEESGVVVGVCRLLNAKTRCFEALRYVLNN